MPELLPTISLTYHSAESAAHKSRFFLYGFLNGVQLILFIILISIFCWGGNQICSSEQGETPISKKPEKCSEREVCVPCTTLPLGLNKMNLIKEDTTDTCCTGKDFSLGNLVKVYVDKAMVSRLQAEEVRDRGLDFHTNMDKIAAESGEILEWEMSPDGSDNKTHLRIGQSGYYFVSADVSFDFRKPEMENTRNASFRVMHLEKATNQTSRLFLSYSVPICVKNDQITSDCIVPNEVGGIKFLEAGDRLFVVTDCPKAVCPDSTSFGFQMIFPGPEANQTTTPKPI